MELVRSSCGPAAQMVNFWLVSVAFLAASFVQTYQNKMLPIAAGVAIAGLIFGPPRRRRSRGADRAHGGPIPVPPAGWWVLFEGTRIRPAEWRERRVGTRASATRAGRWHSKSSNTTRAIKGEA